MPMMPMVLLVPSWLVVSLMMVPLTLVLPLLPLIPVGRLMLVLMSGARVVSDAGVRFRRCVALLIILGPLMFLNPLVLLIFVWSVILLVSLGSELLLRRRCPEAW